MQIVHLEDTLSEFMRSTQFQGIKSIAKYVMITTYDSRSDMTSEIKAFHSRGIPVFDNHLLVLNLKDAISHYAEIPPFSTLCFLTDLSESLTAPPYDVQSSDVVQRKLLQDRFKCIENYWETMEEWMEAQRCIAILFNYVDTYLIRAGSS